MTRIKTLAAAALLLVGVACSGTNETAGTDAKAATTATAAATTSSGASSGATTAAKAATTAATAAAATKAGGTAADACSLITPAEVGQVMGVTGVTVDNLPELNGASNCIYKGPDNKIVVATAYLKAGVGAFNAMGGAQAESGLGDKALWETNTAALMILKGQTVLSITAGDGSMPLARRLELSRQLGALGVARQ